MDQPAPLSDPRDYILELSTVPAPSAHNSNDSPPNTQNSERGGDRAQNSKIPHLSIHFKCCNVYAPIYRNREATAYSGHCPRCAKPLRVPIAPTGTTARIFEAE